MWYCMDQQEELERFLEDHEEFEGIATVGAPMPNKHALTAESPRLNVEKHKKYRSILGLGKYKYAAWVQELQDQQVITAEKVHTALNIADLLTKCHQKCSHTRLIALIEQRANELAGTVCQINGEYM